MEATKFWSVASLAFVLVLCITSTSVTWHCLNEVARLQSRVERLEAEDKGISVSQLLGQLGVQTPVYQGDGAEEDIPGHQREVRQTALHGYIQQIVQSQLEVYLGVTTTETDSQRSKRSTLTPRQWNPLKGEPGPPGPPGARGRSGRKGNKGEQGVPGERGEKGDMGTIGEKGDTGLIGPAGKKGDKGNNGQKGDSGSQGLVGGKGEKGERGDTGPIGPVGAKSQHGDPGPPGEKGEKGDTGSQGPLGGKGDKGEAGLTGPAGEKGERGDTGLTGAEGAKGQPGDHGSKGSSGEKGQKGERGEAGEQCLLGQPGPKGDSPGLDPYTCGGTTGWDRVAYLDMTNSSHQCPGDMVEFTMSGKRVCGRSSAAPRQSCVSAKFSTNGLQYSQVCGSIRGYQYGDPDAFYARASESIESQYVDGVSVTHGPPGNREHVWTFATGLSEDYNSGGVCPCAPNAVLSSIRVPPFVGQDYFCESGFSTGYPTERVLYSDDPLWDGDGCTVAGNTCCQFNNPPYFTKQLSSTTANDLEVRACGLGSQSDSGEDTLIELIALYIKA